MIKRNLVALVLLVACGRSPKPATAPRPTFAAAPVAAAKTDVVLLDNTRTTTLSEGYLTPTELAQEQKAALLASRQDLDVGTVVTLVRERLSSVAVLAVADTIARLRGQTTRPWARDLLTVTAKLATAASADWRPVAESGLRILGRMLIAEAIVRTASTSTDPAEREVLVDWTYWYLAQLELLKDTIEPPSCEGRHATCVAIRDSKEKGSQGKLEELLRVQQILDGVRLVGRLRAAHSNSKLSATLLLEQLMSATSLGSFGVLTDGLDGLTSKLDQLKKVRQLFVAFDRARDAMPRAATKVEAEKAAAKLLAALEATCTVDGKTLKVIELLGRINGDRMSFALADLMPVLKEVARDGDKLPVLLPLLSTDLRPRIEISKDVDDVERELRQLAAFVENHGSLDNLQLVHAAELSNRLKRLLVHLERLEAFAAVSAELVAVARELEVKAKGVLVLVDRLSTLAELTVGETFAKVHASVRALRSVAEARLSTPVLDIVAPIIDKLADGRRLTAGDVFAALSDVGPADLVRALGSDFELDKACDKADSWECWSLRLAMSVHGSLKFDGKLVSVDSSAMIKSMAKLGAESRKTKPGSFHILASVGTGTLYLDDQWRPLVAEQLGTSVVLAGNKKATLSLGAFASGLLYRFVVDDKVADGAMFGGTLLLRLYDLVELHADVTTVLIPGDEAMGTSHRWEAGFIVGAQVPLGDYLERLRD